MGQYFYIADLDKHEYLYPHKLGMGMKLWEICANKGVGAIAYLLRKSDGGGGDDIQRTDAKWAGRWAGDRIVVIGDYDSSRLYQEIDGDTEKPEDKAVMGAPRTKWKDISLEVREEFEDFLGEELGKRWDLPR